MIQEINVRKDQHDGTWYVNVVHDYRMLPDRYDGVTYSKARRIAREIAKENNATDLIVVHRA